MTTDRKLLPPASQTSIFPNNFKFVVKNGLLCFRHFDKSENMWYDYLLTTETFNFFLGNQDKFFDVEFKGNDIIIKLASDSSQQFKMDILDLFLSLGELENLPNLTLYQSLVKAHFSLAG